MEGSPQWCTQPTANMRIAVKIPMYFGAVVSAIMLVLAVLAWPESRWIVRVSMLSGAIAFAGAAVLFLGYDRNRETLIRFGWLAFAPPLGVFIITMVLITYFRY